MAEVPTDLAGLCAEVADLYRQLGEALTPAAALDRSLAPDRTTRWCALHEHLVPYGPVERRCHPGAPKPTLAAAVMPTARPDEGARRGVPGSRPPLSGPARDALVAQEGIWKVAVDLANDLRRTLGHTTRHRLALAALDALPALVDAVEPDLASPGRRQAMRMLQVQRQRARDVLGLSRNVQWLGECEGWYEVDTTRLTRVAGVVVEVTDNLCWVLDLAAMTEGDGDREIWRRSRIALLRDEQTFSGRPRVVCFGCWWEPEDVDISDLVVAHVGLGG